MKRWSSYSMLALAAATILFFAVGISSLISIRTESADEESVEHTHEVLEQLETSLRFAIDARRGAVGYVAVGDSRRLRNTFDAQRQSELALQRVAALTRDNPAQQARVRELQDLLSKERAGFDLVTSTRSRDVEAAVAILQSQEWNTRFVALQSVINAMKSEERRLLELRNTQQDAEVQRAQTLVVGGEALAFLLVLASLVVSVRETRQRRAIETQLSDANRELTARVDDLQQRSSELALLSRFGQLLQSCENIEEAGGIVRSVFPELFLGSRGAAYAIVPSRNLVVPITAWPEGSPQPAAFPPADCWALRGGAMHRVSAGSVNVVCKHAVDDSRPSSVCIPLIAQGETLGLLHVRFASNERQAFDLASAAAEQLSLAIANLSMQETLRRQAVRDPLTGLFNRRYMEETLEREISRAARQKSMVAVLLLDFDHFKEYNDTLGHFAGDDLLRSAAGMMQRAVRAGDVVCRYGGDEFVIIMPDATETVIEQRAHEFHATLAQLPRPDATIGQPVTVSIGIAFFPLDAKSGKDLLLSADAALYAAKRTGRARIARATSPGAAAPAL